MSKGLRNMHKEREGFLIASQYMGNTQKVGQTFGKL